MSEADNRKRNEHVQQQRPSVRKLIYSEFEQQGLTKRNLEYMVKLKEELARTKLPTAKQDDTIQQTLAEIKTAQKTGQTAKGLYGSVANKVENTVHPPQQPQGPLTRKNYLIDAIYNGLWFLILFNFLYAAMYYLTPAAAKQGGAAGITCIILSSVVAGAGMPIVTQLFAPGVKHRQNALLRSLLMVAMFAVWMVVFYGSNLLPRVINPVVPPIINLIIGLVGTGLMLFMRARYTITSGLFAGRK